MNLRSSEKIIVEEDKSIADVLVKVWAKDQTELIKNCLKAFLLISLDKDLKKIKTLVFQETIKEKSLEEKIFSLIDLFIYYKDVKSLLVVQVEIKKLTTSSWQLKFFCQPINQKIKFKTDIKALTHHRFQVKKTTKGYQAVLVFDL